MTEGAPDLSELWYAVQALLDPVEEVEEVEDLHLWVDNFAEAIPSLDTSKEGLRRYLREDSLPFVEPTDAQLAGLMRAVGLHRRKADLIRRMGQAARHLLKMTGEGAALDEDHGIFDIRASLKTLQRHVDEACEILGR